MSQNKINTSAQAAPAAPVTPVPAVEQVKPVQSAPAAPTMAQVVDAVLAARGSDAHTPYAIAIMSNLVFQILDIQKDGKLYQIAPQAVYGKAKTIMATKKAKGEAQTLTTAEARTLMIDKIVGRSGGVAKGERIDKDALLAQTLKALKG